VPAPLRYGEVAAIASTGLATPVPLYIRYRAGGQPVVGTSPDYFAFRGLRLASGRLPAIAGEAVLGAAAARNLDAKTGGSVVTSPDTVFDVSGTYPLKLNVVGVLAATGTPDDEAVFVDVRTAWVIGGIGHGHENLEKPEAAAGVLKRDGDTIVANAAVVQYREITPDNLADFHFHGEQSTFPLSAIIAVPDDEKSGVMFEGRYQDPNSQVQIVRPNAVMERLLQTVLTVRQYVLVAVLLVGAATLTTLALVFALSARLRRAEIRTMTRIGAPPGQIYFLLGAEVLLVLVISTAIALLLTAFAGAFGEQIFRTLLLSGA